MDPVSNLVLRRDASYEIGMSFPGLSLQDGPRHRGKEKYKRATLLLILKPG
jgi:hypothetical protein